MSLPMYEIDPTPGSSYEVSTGTSLRRKVRPGPKDPRRWCGVCGTNPVTKRTVLMYSFNDDEGQLFLDIKQFMVCEHCFEVLVDLVEKNPNLVFWETYEVFFDENEDT